MRASVRIKIIIAAAAVLLALLAVGLLVRVEDISVTGNKYFSSSEIIDDLFAPKMSRAPLMMLAGRFTGRYRAFYLEGCSVRLTGLTSASVQVKERAFMGYVSFLGSNLYFDRDGVILKSTKETFPDIPEVRGLQFDSAVLGRQLPLSRETLLMEVLQISQYLAAEKVDWGGEKVTLSSLVDAIDFDDNESVRCQVEDIVIMLGDGSSLEGKLHEMSDILPSLQGRSGVLHLENYDPANGAALYRFE